MNNSENFKIGPCALVWNGVPLGGALKGPVITMEPEVKESTEAQSGKLVIRRNLLNMRIMIAAEIKEIDAGISLLLNENNQFISAMLNKDQMQQGAELLLIPYNPEDTTGYRFPNAVITGKSEYAYKEYEEHSMQIEFSIHPDDQTCVFMEKFVVAEAQRPTFSNALSVPVADIERALTQFIADKLNLTIDVDIFRGGIPVGVDGCGVELLREACSNTLARRKIELAFEMKGVSRDAILQALHDLSGHLPAYGLELTLGDSTIVNIAALLKDRIDISHLADDGETKTTGMVTLTAII